LFQKIKSLEGQVQLLCIENANLKEGQKKAIEDSLKSGPELYFSA